MRNKFPLVAIVGRTNVGKSSLFNALLRRRVAVVEDTPGVTRDRHYAHVKEENFQYTLIDTGGYVGEDDNPLAEAVRSQVEVAIKEADIILAVFDGLNGVNPLDEEVVRRLRGANKPVVWVVNKCERELTGVLAAEFYALGVDNLIPVSAAHRQNLADIIKALQAHWPHTPPVVNRVEELETPSETPQPIRIAIIGRPNVGKSSLVNRICGEERLVVSNLAGTTTDSIDTLVRRDGKEFLLIDTAGLRKKGRVDDATVERYANLRTLKSLARSDLACLLLDASTETPSEQDKAIARLVHERGRGLCIVVNKWDLVEKDHTSAHKFKEHLLREMPYVKYAPILFISALTGRRCPNVLDTADQIYAAARQRIPTSDLNNILQQAFQAYTAPVIRGEPVKLYFATQTQVAPPTIVMFLNYPKEMNATYIRYLKNKIRDSYPFPGSDIKFILKKRTSKMHREMEEKGISIEF